MKKILCLTFALCLMIFTLAACGKDDDTSSLSSAAESSSSAEETSSAAPTATPAAQTARAAKVTADDGLNIRAEASTDAEILGVAENGSLLPLLMENATDGWYEVEYEGKTAYISADYATVTEVTLEEYNKLRSSSSSDDDDSSSSSDTSDTGEASTSSGDDSSQSSEASDNEDGE